MITMKEFDELKNLHGIIRSRQHALKKNQAVHDFHINEVMNPEQDPVSKTLNSAFTAQEE